LTANPLRPITISPQLLHASKVFLTTSTGTSSVTQAFDDVIALMAEGHYLSSAWTQTIALDDLIAEGFEPLRRGEKVKVLVDMARTGAD
jgi:Zn-dependent alcohol dehydrogenase